MRRRRMVRSILLLVSLCVAMWRLPSTIETFAGTLGSGGTPDASVRAALHAATGRTPTPAPGGASEARIFAAGGRELADAERERLLRQARAGAPPTPTGEDTTDRVERELRRILAERKPPG